jgi:GT2 family glycosyltransferase
MLSKITISIVSHGHQPMICESGLIANFRGFDIILRENVPDAPRLVGAGEGVTVVQNLQSAGFGANHNRNFELVDLEEDDWFVICNPDIVADAVHVTRLLELAEKDGADIAAPALWNNNLDCFDENVRPFPTLASLALSFAGAASYSRYSEDTLVGLRTPDWASGAFIAFKAGLFHQLCGFDERYFMYMEDLDICRRARERGHYVGFYPEVQLIHNAARHNRRIFSRNFRYHLTSIFKYFLKNRLGL